VVIRGQAGITDADYYEYLRTTQGSENLMSADRVAFALWNASVNQSDMLVLQRRGILVELQLRGGNASLRSIVLRKRE
jgi:hypothetical protein